VSEGGIALGEGSGFVDDDEFYFGKFFEGGGVTNQNTEAGGAGESAGGGDGGGESEGTGASGDKNGYGTTDGIRDRFASENPADGGGEGEKEDERSENAGDFIGDTLEGWGIFFGFIDKTSESGDEGVVAGFFGKDEESAARDKGSTEYGVARKFFDGKGFAGEDGFFDRGVAFEDFSVGGDGFAWEDEEVLTGLNIGPGNNFFDRSLEEASGGRGEREEIFQRLGEFRFGALFDPLTRENKGGYRGGSIEKRGVLASWQEK